MSHAPGPWFYGVAEDPKRGPVPFGYESPGYYDNAGVISQDGTLVVGCDEYHVFNSEADARLITAAPELLAALQWAVKLYEEYGLVASAYECGKWVNSARDAIAKATQGEGGK